MELANTVSSSPAPAATGRRIELLISSHDLVEMLTEGRLHGVIGGLHGHEPVKLAYATRDANGDLRLIFKPDPDRSLLQPERRTVTIQSLAHALAG